MDIPTLLGILAGIGLVLAAIFTGGSAGKFIDVPSLMIVVGGVCASIFISFPAEEVMQAIRAGVKVFSSRKTKSAEVVDTMVQVAEISRREGLLALEKVQADNPLLKKATQLIADNAGNTLIHETVTIEIASMKRRHNIGISVFQKLGVLGPTFGMIGTLIGLVQMLANMSDPSALGPAMAVAILTTFYGSFIANLLFIPMADKLKARSMQEELVLFIIFEGAKCILENNNPRLVYEKLSSFLPPAERVKKDDK